jgi:hypothetical protein
VKEGLRERKEGRGVVGDSKFNPHDKLNLLLLPLKNK